MPKVHKIRKTEELINLTLHSPQQFAKSGNVPVDQKSETELEPPRQKSRDEVTVQIRSPLIPLNRVNADIASVQSGCDEHVNLKPLEHKAERKIIKAKRMIQVASSMTENIVPLSTKRKRLKKQNQIDYGSMDKVPAAFPLIHDLNDSPMPSPIQQNFVEKKNINKASNVVVTTLKYTISPSTSSVKDTPPTSPSNASFQFECSNEQLSLSTSGGVDVSRRRTFELESSVNDVLLLKSLSEQDSFRMSSIQDSPFAKVTMRRKFEKTKSTSSPRTPLQMGILAKRLQKVENSRLGTTMSGRRSQSLPRDVSGGVPSQKSTNKKVRSQVKMPNFAAIHQKMLDGVENIVQYKQRKEERSKMLLSGQKPVAPKTIKKQLRFATGMCDTVKPPLYIPLPSTPLPFKSIHHQSSQYDDAVAPQPFLSEHKIPPVLCSVKPLVTNFTCGAAKNLNFTPLTPNTLTDKPSTSERNTPVSTAPTSTDKFNRRLKTFKLLPAALTANPTATNFSNGLGKNLKFVPVVPNTWTSKEGLKRQLPSTFKGLSNKPKTFDVRSNGSASKKQVAFDFEKKALPCNKEELKAMVLNKTRKAKDGVEARRFAIKGVRSNRRFDLLMNMRKGK